MSIEDHLARNIDKKRQLERQQQSATRAVQPHPVASPEELQLAANLEQKRGEETLNIRDPYFASTKEETKARDEAYVQAMQKNHREKMTPRERELLSIASGFEYVISKRINEAHWLGDDIRAQLTSPYDDYKNGIDLYLERVSGENANPLGLSIDVTFSSKEADIGGKMNSIKNFLLDRGRLAELRYYRPISDEVRAKNIETNVFPTALLPKVIIGVTKQNALNAMSKYAKGDSRERDLGTGFTVLYQIERQLEAFAEYSELVGRKDKPWTISAAQRYRATLEEIRGLSNKKYESLGVDPQKVALLAQKDPITSQIHTQLFSLLESARQRRA